MCFYKKETSFHAHELEELEQSRQSKIKFKVVDELRDGRYKIELVKLDGIPLQLIKKSCGEERSKSLNREKNILKEINHENIIKLFAYTTYSSWKSIFTVEIFTEYCLNGSLKRYLKKVKKTSKTLFLRQSKSLLRQVFDAVDFLHSKLIFHGDLKPANMLVTEHISLKLIDFEMAGQFEPGVLKFDGTTRGTTSFKSPECHWRMARCPAKCDVWSLGVVMIVIFAKDYKWHQPDYSDENFVWFMERVDGNLQDGVKRLSCEEKEVVLMCLQKDPNKRAKVSKIIKTDWYKQ